MFSAAALRTYLGIWLTDLFYTAKITLNRRANRNKKNTQILFPYKKHLSINVFHVVKSENQTRKNPVYLFMDF